MDVYHNLSLLQYAAKAYVTGMDICTYMKEGVGRHADSLGNRETFNTPGVQWCSVGSGIEHAEAGGTPEGMNETGFQVDKSYNPIYIHKFLVLIGSLFNIY